jgi:hypothetical protein
VNVIGHLDVGMNGALPFDGPYCQCVQEVVEVVFGKETCRAIIASLNDMPGNPGDRDPCTSGHREPPCSQEHLTKAS